MTATLHGYTALMQPAWLTADTITLKKSFDIKSDENISSLLIIIPKTPPNVSVLNCLIDGFDNYIVFEDEATFLYHFY